MQTRQRDAGPAAFFKLAGIGRAQPIHHAGNLAVEREQAHIFAAHHSRGLDHALFAQRRHGDPRIRSASTGSLIRGRRALSYGHGRHPVGGNTVGLRQPIRSAAIAATIWSRTAVRVSAQRNPIVTSSGMMLFFVPP